MNCSHIRRRVEKLAAKIWPSGGRQHAFEDLCRLMWRQDKRGFLVSANGDCPFLRVFVSSFEREDLERGAGMTNYRYQPLTPTSWTLVSPARAAIGPHAAVGNKLAGAVVVMLALPFAALLVLAASICSLVCLSRQSTTADQDKYFAFQKIIERIRKREGINRNRTA
jgi:hypothetical protein